MTKRYDTELTAKELANLPVASIDTCDIPELDDAFWASARIVAPQTKTAISIRIDDDVLEWFKTQGKGYQSRINAVLRAYYEARRG